MAEITIRLPDSMKDYVDAQLATGEYPDATEFFHFLLREDQKRRAKEYLKAKIRDAAASGPPEEITPAYWNEVEETFHKKYGPEKSL